MIKCYAKLLNWVLIRFISSLQNQDVFTLASPKISKLILIQKWKTFLIIELYFKSLYVFFVHFYVPFEYINRQERKIWATSQWLVTMRVTSKHVTQTTRASWPVSDMLSWTTDLKLNKSNDLILLQRSNCTLMPGNSSIGRSQCTYSLLCSFETSQIHNTNRNWSIYSLLRLPCAVIYILVQYKGLWRKLL